MEYHRVLETTGSSEEISFDYQPADLVGWLSFVDASASASLGLGLGGGGTIMFLEGTGTFPELMIDLSGWTQNAGANIGGEVGMSWGRITLGGKKHTVKDKDHIASMADYSEVVDSITMARVQFELGDALLTEGGRQLLRIFAAAELMSLNSPGSRLTIKWSCRSSGYSRAE